MNDEDDPGAPWVVGQFGWRAMTLSEIVEGDDLDPAIAEEVPRVCRIDAGADSSWWILRTHSSTAYWCVPEWSGHGPRAWAVESHRQCASGFPFSSDPMRAPTVTAAHTANRTKVVGVLHG